MFKGPFQQCTKHIDNILKGTLQLEILQTWINVRANSFIKTSVNIMKWKYQLHKHPSLVLEKNIVPK